MLKQVERLYIKSIDPNERKVEDLRKYTREMFAIVHFSPRQWGDKTKRKSLNV